MGTIADRYDASSERYRTWWEPVLAATAVGVFRELDRRADLAFVPRRVLDLGTGAGLLAIEAIRRWPQAIVVGLDASSGMLGVAGSRAAEELSAAERARLELVAGHAGSLPFASGSFDLVISSFVLQLVPNRPATLREAHRVLRPGGRLATVTWLAGNERFEPDEAFESALDELDFDDEGEAEEVRSGEYVSAAAAASQLRRTGFREVAAHESTLEHAYERARYVDFLEEYAERDVFEDLDTATRARLRRETQARLDRLSDEAFTWRAPVVFATARRPHEGSTGMPSASETRSESEPADPVRLSG